MHSHKPPIVHRDSKPSNLKLTPKGKIILLDFGLAKGTAGQMSTAQAESYSQSIYGFTQHYAPLEQMRGAGTEPRSDLYSLAATLWTLLTASIPPDALARVTEKEEGNADPLRPADELNADVPPSVAAVLQSAMSLNRNQRPANAVEMRKALRHALEPEHNRAATQLLQDKGERDGERNAMHAAQPPLPISAAAPSQPSSDASQTTPAEQTPTAPNMPTMVANAPPEPISWSGQQSSPPTVASFAGEKPEKGRKRGALIIAVVLAAVVIAAVVAVVWQSSRTPEGAPSSTENKTQGNKAAAPTTGKEGVPAGMVNVPGGEFTMGRNGRDGGDEYERPAHRVTVKPFFIDVYEVTNEDYAKFIKATDNLPPPTWTNKTYPAGTGRKPVTGVTWD